MKLPSFNPLAKKRDRTGKTAIMNIYYKGYTKVCQVGTAGNCIFAADLSLTKKISKIFNLPIDKVGIKRYNTYHSSRKYKFERKPPI
jgi:hypothetical protein